MKRVVTYLIFVATPFFFQNCDQANRERLIKGTWRVDSVYTFHNGYGFTIRDNDEQPLLKYEKNGLLSMLKGKEERFFHYTIKNDSLIHSDTHHFRIGAFKILEVSATKLIIRKQKRGIFKNQHDDRFEIRYLSKIGS